MKTLIKKIGYDTVQSDMERLFSDLSLEVDTFFLQKTIKNNLGGDDDYIDFVVEDTLRTVMKSLNMENDIDYSYSLLNDDCDFAVIGITLASPIKK